jgi:hypothetical protein
MVLQCEGEKKLINSNTPHPTDEFDDLHGTVYGELGFRGATRLHHNGFFFFHLLILERDMPDLHGYSENFRSRRWNFFRVICG